MGLVKTVTEVLNGVNNVSPVDTGRFRANWIVDYVDTDRQPYPEGAIPAQADSPKLSKEGFDGSVWLNNNVVYASALERGHSGKAPQGVVRPTLNRLGLKGIFEGE